MRAEQKSLILVADDDKTVRVALVKFLERSGYRTVSATDGQEALEAFTEQRPDLVIADLRMPRMSGLELLKTLRCRNFFTPVVVTTGYPDMDSAIEAIHNGAFDYIVKPFRVEIVGRKVEQALDTVRLARENVVLSELVSLHEISKQLTATHDLEELLDVTFESCLRVLRAASGSIQLVDKARRRLAIARKQGIDSPILSSALEDHDEWRISKWVVANGQSLLFADGKAYPEIDIPVERPDIGSSLCVPLRVENEIVGVVSLNRPKGEKPFTMVDLNTIEVLASQAGVAINNANLYTSLNRKVDELSLISTYSERLMGLVDREEIVLALFKAMREHFGIEVMGFLAARRRSFELLYSTTGPVSEDLVRRVCDETIEAFRGATGAKVGRKRVTMRRVEEPPEGGGRIEEPFAFRYVMPLLWEDFSFGTLFLAARSGPERRDETMALLLGLINQTRIALTNARLYTDMRQNYIRTIKALAIAVDAKDTYTHGHSENVMNIAEAVAAEMELDDKWMGIIRDAGLLHDIGKIGIPGYILNKPGPLTYEEFNGIMKTHSNLGANIVKDVPFLEDLYSLILYHHEHYDGSGYPEGLRGEEIPLGARILHVADAFEAMTSNRPYRSSLGETEAVKRLEEQSGKQFDPKVVAAFARMARKKGWIGGNGR